MHVPEGGAVSGENYFLVTGFCGKELSAVPAADAERVRGSGVRGEPVVDSPAFKEAGGVGSELEAGLDF